MSALDELTAVMKRIGDLTGTAGYQPLAVARGLPASYARNITDLSINKQGYHSELSEEEKKAIALMRARLAMDEHKRGCKERTNLLATYSGELEQLRDVLPGLAARASIEIGIKARELAAESRKGD